MSTLLVLAAIVLFAVAAVCAFVGALSVVSIVGLVAVGLALWAASVLVPHVGPVVR